MNPLSPGVDAKAQVKEPVIGFAVLRHISLRPLQPLAAWISPLALLWLWYWATLQQWVPEQILPSPALVWASFVELAESGELQDNLSISLFRLFSGFGIGAVAGVIVGVLLAISPQVRAYLGLTFELLRHIPTLVMVPMLILLLGIGETFKIVILVKAVFFPVAQAATDAVRNIPRGFIEVGRVYQLKPLALYRDILLPATVPPVLTGMRIALGRAWLILVAVELLAADTGIGQMMEFARQMLRLDIVLVGVVLTGLIGFGLDKSLRLLEHRLMRWKPSNPNDNL
ncbi:ABC transporter permease [Cellvibrio japonicus]|uniref:AtsB n=1 Tax=Cellvibrio japonicus (strain Ueda107) TaxID=498211 RepID=B3PJW1_CELJU|nr:ABC transporter permease [Cellvibrio japonicus]ACE86106.1 AtsB [Cellvibrio japonicus Ueda107]QEI12740.1 ABC transporter permease [Cellvibrio japonicus]QEI16314.1 ABC transporter permease [Cellvibrio japonicus]QEI19892.1 ABC transporter permease [Cellvibrio japonicus]